MNKEYVYVHFFERNKLKLLFDSANIKFSKEILEFISLIEDEDDRIATFAFFSTVKKILKDKFNLDLNKLFFDECGFPYISKYFISFSMKNNVWGFALSTQPIGLSIVSDSYLKNTNFKIIESKKNDFPLLLADTIAYSKLIKHAFTENMLYNKELNFCSKLGYLKCKDEYEYVVLATKFPYEKADFNVN